LEVASQGNTKYVSVKCDENKEECNLIPHNFFPAFIIATAGGATAVTANTRIAILGVKTTPLVYVTWM
jgi:hypothetical protein